MTRPKIHHYIPQFLLRNFTTDGKVFVFDKKTRKSFRTNPRNIACEKGFNECTVEGKTFSLEEYFSRLETQWAPIIEKIVSKKDILFLTEGQRAVISQFIAVQSVRTPRIPAQMDDFREKATEIVKFHLGEARLSEVIPPKDNDFDKLTHLRLILDLSKELAQYVFNMDWILLEAFQTVPFVIGDSAITMSNEYENGPYGNIGFAVKGINVSIPLSPDLGLLCICKSYLFEFEQMIKKINAIKAISPHALPKDKEESARSLGEIIDVFKNKRKSECLQDNMTYYNANQTLFSEQYVFSNKNDFSLVESILDETPDASCGMRVRRA